MNEQKRGDTNKDAFMVYTDRFIQTLALTNRPFYRLNCNSYLQY